MFCVNNLKKELKARLDSFEHILYEALFICESKLNDKMNKKDVSAGSKCKLIRRDKTSNLGNMTAWIRSDILQKKISELDFNCDIDNFIDCMMF